MIWVLLLVVVMIRTVEEENFESWENNRILEDFCLDIARNNKKLREGEDED